MQDNNKQLLLAKFKETIKLKNSQIQTLKESLEKVNDFKTFSDELKRELANLKADHEKWTVSIAECKRSTHQELEHKNIEIIKLKSEISEYQSKIQEINSSNRQIKINLQNLESRLVSTCAAHQKERETLTRDLTIARNNAVRQIQREHELNVERVKLELEKSVEALKVALLRKDQQLMENTQVQQLLAQQNGELLMKIEELNDQLNCRSKELSDLKKKHDECVKQYETIGTMTDDNKEEVLVKNCDDTREGDSKDVEHEYLKNVVLKFMMGQEPVILARVIATILKFDETQTDQICRIQDAIHTVSKH